VQRRGYAAHIRVVHELCPKKCEEIARIVSFEQGVLILLKCQNISICKAGSSSARPGLRADRQLGGYRRVLDPDRKIPAGQGQIAIVVGVAVTQAMLPSLDEQLMVRGMREVTP
jgi:hypothetical protein